MKLSGGGAVIILLGRGGTNIFACKRMARNMHSLEMYIHRICPLMALQGDTVGEGRGVRGGWRGVVLVSEGGGEYCVFPIIIGHSLI